MKIAISAGEVSGDEHAARVVRELARLYSDSLEFQGMGGRHLREAGVITVVDSETDASVMGFAEVLSSAGTVLRALKSMKALLRSWRPDLLIVVDYQDFHFRLVRTAKSLGIPVLFFISPSVWAWRTGRIKLVERYVDRMAVIFPFERSFYERYGCKKAVYVGHPYSEEPGRFSRSESLRTELLTKLSLSTEKPTALLMPGSRNKEIQMHLQPMVEAFELVRKTHPELQGILSAAPGVDAVELRKRVESAEGLVVTDENAITLMRVADAGIVKSGTSNLQAAYCGLPFTMVYIASTSTKTIVRLLQRLGVVKTNVFSIVNIIRENSVKEFIQEEANAAALSIELVRLLFEKNSREDVKANLHDIHKLLTSPDPLDVFKNATGVYGRVAALALDLLPSKQ
jgi:lipid-A-disaccharide synthase